LTLAWGCPEPGHRPGVQEARATLTIPHCQELCGYLWVYGVIF
jgi:hypothetical protein